MTQDLTGGYCPRCDTVWASPGVCNCDSIKLSQKEMDQAVKTYKIVGIDKAMAINTEPLLLGSGNDSVLVREIWNEAIEAAAKCVDQANRDGPYHAIISARAIRRLKK